MRAYWLIEGVDKPLYTAYPARIVIDKKTGREYQTGKMVFLKKADAPKNLIENEVGRYDYIRLRDEEHIEGNFRKITVITKSFPTADFQKKDICGLLGLWIVEGLNPTTYTQRACTYIRDKATGKKYKRGAHILFRTEEEYPDFANLAEYSGKYDIVYNWVFNQSTNGDMTQEDYVREIWAQSIFKK